jgi:hypothetical protein
MMGKTKEKIMSFIFRLFFPGINIVSLLEKGFLRDD